MTKTEARFALLGANTGNCLRVAIALEALNIEYEPIKIDLKGGEQHQANFLAKNPFGLVPVLLDRTFKKQPYVLAQSNAILLELCERVPGILLPHHSDPSRAMVMERFFYFVTDVIAYTTTSFFLSRIKDQAGAQLLLSRALDAIAESERFLTQGPYMAGKTFSLADIAALTVIKTYSDRLLWTDMPTLRTWFDLVTSRNDVRRGLDAFS